MGLPKGVFEAKKTDGTIYFRASITYRNKHISLGSFNTVSVASDAYLEADKLLHDTTLTITTYQEAENILTFDKWVSLINFRDNKIYFKNPIYLYSKYFIYFLNRHTELKFDVDDLFYYSHHKILKRGGHLFVADYGMQVNILSRYGIKNYAVPGKDYVFVNGDFLDYRYRNIQILNRYYGVSKEEKSGRISFAARININGSYLIGRYQSETDAAIAYNKAVDILKSKGLTKNFNENYIEDYNSIQYAARYNTVRISNKIRELSFE